MAESLGSIINRWLRDNGLEDKFRENSVPDYWVEIVGEGVARNAKLERVEHGRMVIRAENPAWKQEIITRREDIRAKVNERFGTEVVTEVFVI
ncbi:MAG: DUF721 domain-containing protein [Chlorobi bacterium]|nr:DUF721 domain-containing protein [Chlorobiota bacterium]